MVTAFKVEFSGEQVALEISGEQTGDYPVVFLFKHLLLKWKLQSKLI